MKQCKICGEDLSGYGRYKYCLGCGDLITAYYCEHSKEGYKWAVQKVKEIVENKKARNERSNY